MRAGNENQLADLGDSFQVWRVTMDKYMDVVDDESEVARNCSRETVFSSADFPVRVGYYQGKDLLIPVSSFYHSEMEIQLICQGSGEYFIEGQVYSVRKNSILIIHKNELHNFVGCQGGAIKKVNVIFSPSVLKGRPTSLSLLKQLTSYHHLVLTDKEATLVEVLLDEISEEISSSRISWQEIITGNVEKLIILLVRATSSQQPLSVKENPVIQEVIRYIDEHYAERISLSEVARHFYINTSSLSRMFKAFVGIGFKEYINHKRIIEAKKLLDETDQKIAAISNAVGFDDLSAFGRNFRNLTGFNPSSYRKLHA